MSYHEPADDLDDNMPIEPLEDNEVPADGGEEEFLDPELPEDVNDAEIENLEEIEEVKRARPNDKRGGNPRRSVEDYLEKKRLREEIGSVFDDDDDDVDINLEDEEGND